MFYRRKDRLKIIRFEPLDDRHSEFDRPKIESVRTTTKRCRWNVSNSMKIVEETTRQLKTDRTAHEWTANCRSMVPSFKSTRTTSPFEQPAEKKRSCPKRTSSRVESNPKLNAVSICDNSSPSSSDTFEWRKVPAALKPSPNWAEFSVRFSSIFWGFRVRDSRKEFFRRSKRRSNHFRCLAKRKTNKFEYFSPNEKRRNKTKCRK